MTESTAAPTPSGASVWEDFVDIFTNPSAVFERRRDGQFGLALAILAVLTGILAFALHNGLGPGMDAVIAKQQAAIMAKNPAITQDSTQLDGRDDGEDVSIRSDHFRPDLCILQSIKLRRTDS
ncbi:MAG: hypothetical protein ABJC63_14605 [Gemmatimonadales bacterium]